MADDLDRLFGPPLVPVVSFVSLKSPDPPTVTEAFTDGGCRGNPGPAGYGVVIRHRGERITLKGTLPCATNNEAEYAGLLACLRWAVDQQVTPLVVRMDSEVVVRQMQGRYAVRDRLRPLYIDACKLVVAIGHVTFIHVRREYNREADLLANEAMDEAGFPRQTRTGALQSWHTGQPRKR